MSPTTEVIAPPAAPSATSTNGSSAASSSPWIYRPWLDLLIGCGAWSAPLLLIAAYTGLLLHTSYRLLPWVFTLYICWSPWHYTGQNYGLLLMFARRSGASVTPAERKWLRAAFIASYLLLLASFETGGSADPLIISLGLPASFTLPLRLVLAAAFALFGVLAFRRLIAQHGLRAIAAPLTLYSTQFLWFVLPTLLELHAAYQIPQTRYSSGVLAVLHSAQYLWITSYFQKREFVAAGKSDWRLAKYFITLIAGGIALFIPGPWLVSYLFRFDFTTSFLIFTSLVNIHHFLLDGAIWKLRDTKVSSLLTGRNADQPQAQSPSRRQAAKVVMAHASAKTAAKSKKSKSALTPPVVRKRRLWEVPAFQVAIIALLFLWGAIDQLHFAFGTDGDNLSSLRRAVQMNPYDSVTEDRIASAEARQGQRDESIQSLLHAVEINPENIALQQASARALIQSGRFDEAYAHYRQMLKIFPDDADSLINYGLLAARFGKPDEAITSWQKALAVDNDQPNPHLYLAESFDQKGDPANAALHWNAFLHLAQKHPENPAAVPAQQTAAMIQLADDYVRLNQPNPAFSEYRYAIANAGRIGDSKSESLALVHFADLQEKSGDVPSAARSYQRALALDAQGGAQPLSQAVTRQRAQAGPNALSSPSPGSQKVAPANAQRPEQKSAGIASNGNLGADVQQGVQPVAQVNTPENARGNIQGNAASDASHGTKDARVSAAAANQPYDPRSEAFDWFDYGQFLRRHAAPDELAYACFLRAESLLAAHPSVALSANHLNQQLQTVQNARRELVARLGKKEAQVQEDLPNLLARAATLPPSSLRSAE